MAGSFLSEQLRGNEEALSKLDVLVVQELFETDTTAFADVVLPAASFAEIDGTYTNSDGLCSVCASRFRGESVEGGLDDHRSTSSGIGDGF